MSYNLNALKDKASQKQSTSGAVKKIMALMAGEHRNLYIALCAVLINSFLTLLSPVIIGHVIDKYIQTKQFHGVLVFSGILLCMYIMSFFTAYFQTKLMGQVSQRMLFNLRNRVFNKLQELPVDFFYQNKAGDLISRINSDTDKLNMFFSQSLIQFLSSIFIMTGSALFLLSINLPLGAAALVPALLVLIFTQIVSPRVKRKNAESLKTTGGLSGEIQESLNNFKVIIAFNRRDYFRQRFDQANEKNYSAAISAGMASNVFMPMYGLAAGLAQMIVLSLGIYLIVAGHFTIGLLVGFLAYINRFYSPLRQLAALWANFQLALASWDRISEILNLSSNLPVNADENKYQSNSLLSFQDVSFSYPNGKEVLHKVNFELERGKTYAFVGPTGGGKTTTASLIARLYDPTKGAVLLHGKDIRSYQPSDRGQKIGFILQEPFLFTGTVRENILYGNAEYATFSAEQLAQAISAAGLDGLLERFDAGLDSKVQNNDDSMSLGQKQLIAFMRAVLRKPDILILDEATANIDTVTEKLLDTILQNLPASTTRVIIAHRLNTIENADEIYFVNSGKITRAGSLKDAVSLLLNEKMSS